MELKTIQEKMQNCVSQARALQDEWEGKGGMPTDVEAQVDKLFNEFDELKGQAEAIEKTQAFNSRFEAANAYLSQSKRLPGLAGNTNARQTTKEMEEKALWQHWYKNGSTELELKALQADVDTSGGYLVPPAELSMEIIKAMDNVAVVRPLARITQVAHAGVAIPSLDTDFTDATYDGEIASATEDTSMAYGKRVLKPAHMNKLVKVSRALLANSGVNLEQYIGERLGYAFGNTGEKKFLLGTGVNQPLGMFVASNDGIPTSRDTTAASASTVTGDELMTVKHLLKAQYWTSPSTRWIMARSLYDIIRKLKDSNTGQYLWATSYGMAVAGNAPETLLGIPVLISENANAVAASTYVAVVGDLSYYRIAEVSTLEISRLNELYAANNEVGFIGHFYHDGQPVLAEAFSRLKMHS